VAVASDELYASLHLDPQTDNHASTPSLSFLQAGCPSCHPTISPLSLVEMPGRVVSGKNILISTF